MQMVQGLWTSDKDLQQIFSEQAIERMHDKTNKHGRKPGNLRSFLDIPRAERPILPLLQEEDRKEVEAILHDMPDLQVCALCLITSQQSGVTRGLQVDSKFEVVDYADICEEDVVTATFTITHRNLVGDDNAADIDVANRKVPLVHAVRFPVAKSEQWFMFLVDEHYELSKRATQKKIISFQIFTPTKAVEGVKIMFQAPAKAGQYKYKLHLLSADYMGLDVVQDVSFTVKPKEKVDVIEEVAPEEELGDGLTLENMLRAYGAGDGGADSDLDSDADDEDGDGELEESNQAGAATKQDDKPDANVSRSKKESKKSSKVEETEDDDLLPSIIMGAAKSKKAAKKPAVSEAAKPE
jgi:hypothetical protein